MGWIPCPAGRIGGAHGGTQKEATTMERVGATIALEGLAAVFVEVDGVAADTWPLHAAAWKRTFDELLRKRARGRSGRFRPFDLRDDFRLMSGMSPPEAARAFASSRSRDPTTGLLLPDGDGGEAVALLWDRKDRYYLDSLRTVGSAASASTAALLAALRAAGVRTAAVSCDRGATETVRAVGMADLFDTVVDGRVAEGLSGARERNRAVLTEAGRRLEVGLERTAALLSSVPAVHAAHGLGIPLVVAVDRNSAGNGVAAEALITAWPGANAIVADPAEITTSGALPGPGA